MVRNTSRGGLHGACCWGEFYQGTRAAEPLPSWAKGSFERRSNTRRREGESGTSPGLLGPGAPRVCQALTCAGSIAPLRLIPAGRTAWPRPLRRAGGNRAPGSSSGQTVPEVQAQERVCLSSILFPTSNITHVLLL